MVRTVTGSTRISAGAAPLGLTCAQPLKEFPAISSCVQVTMRGPEGCISVGSELRKIGDVAVDVADSPLVVKMLTLFPSLVHTALNVPEIAPLTENAIVLRLDSSCSWK